jgi:hypothetical protein
MNFAKFYNIINEQVASQGDAPQPVSFEFMRGLVTQDDTLVNSLDVWRVSYTPPTNEARFTLFDERDSRWDEPLYNAEISFCSSLEANPEFLLFALTKELMHVFDPMETWINTRDKFISFLKDLQNSPLEMENGSIRVEHRAKWMALLALIPASLRDYIVASTANKSRNEISVELGLPRSLVDTALDEYYLTALKMLVE